MESKEPIEPIYQIDSIEQREPIGIFILKASLVQFYFQLFLFWCENKTYLILNKKHALHLKPCSNQLPLSIVHTTTAKRRFCLGRT